jgi:HPt (histidine-containing phosphotransfer) domain-containing protein
LHALNKGDIKLAHRLAHTLKSNAAYLGKILLQQAAANIEDQLKDGQNNVSPQNLATLETELKAALLQLSAEIEMNPAQQTDEVSTPDVQTEQVSAEFTKELFEKLETMLDMGNLECRNLIDSLRRIPQTEKLIQQIDDLDFHEAFVTLGELRKKEE